jgi:hypothetical protein
VDPSGKSESPATHCFLYIGGTALVTFAGLAAVIVGLIFAPAGFGFALLVIGLIAFVGGVMLLTDAILSCD